jgi:hypothetical protein
MSNDQDPLDFIKNMWNGMGFALPGMVAPTLDTNELDKQISNLKTVEGWLKSNLGMLQMTIHGLEMQRTTLAAMQAISESASSPDANANPFANPAFWPWPFMPQAQAAAEEPAAASADPKPADAATASKPKKKTQ